MQAVRALRSRREIDARDAVVDPEARQRLVEAPAEDSAPNRVRRGCSRDGVCEQGAKRAGDCEG
jgi:hypothetical protein